MISTKCVGLTSGGCPNTAGRDRLLCPSCAVKAMRGETALIAQTPTNSTPIEAPVTRAEMDDLKQDIRELGTKLHEFADLLLRAGKKQ